MMKNILVVDDHEDSLRYLKSLLESQGCHVRVASHGAEALDMARQEPPDLVVSDLLMPVMDGYTLLRHWRGDRQLAHVPFVVYTATYTEPEDERLAVHMGADAFLLKPIEPQELFAILRELSHRNKKARPTAPRQAAPEVMREYSEALIRKLEQKTLELERVKRELEEDISAKDRAYGLQMAILDALPAQIALLDAEGVIRAVNHSWRGFAMTNDLDQQDFGVGQNYLDVCERATGDCSEEARTTARGIRSVLRGGSLRS